MSILVSAIVAVDENNGIGYQNKMPWHIPEDLQHFRDITYGKPVIVGRKTLESIGKALPGRDVFVVSRDRNYDGSQYSVRGMAPTPALALMDAQQLAYQSGIDEVIVIGGQTIYNELGAAIQRIYRTCIKGTNKADVYFPIDTDKGWIVTESRPLISGPTKLHLGCFQVLERSD